MSPTITSALKMTAERIADSGVASRMTLSASSDGYAVTNMAGTITYGNRRASRFVPAEGVTLAELTEAARIASLADLTPEGRSIVDLAVADTGASGTGAPLPAGAEPVEFTAQTRMSGVDLPDGRELRKGAGSAVEAWTGVGLPAEVGAAGYEISMSGGTPLLVAERRAGATRVLGVVHLNDVVK